MTASDRIPDQPQFVTERDPRLRVIIPMIVAVAFLMEQLDSTIITTAIPDMAISLGTTPLRLNLAVTTYVPDPGGVHPGQRLVRRPVRGAPDLRPGAGHLHRRFGAVRHGRQLRHAARDAGGAGAGRAR